MLRICAREFVGPRTLWREAFHNGWCWLLPKFVGEADLEGHLARLWIRWIVCVHAQHPWKYGPHGELFFSLILKEPASMPGSETVSPFLNADIRTPFFSADVLKRCALIALHLIAEHLIGNVVW